MQGKFNWAAVAIATAAGLLIGFAASTFAYRHGYLRVPGGGVMQRMVRELKLTPGQRRQIAEMMKETRSQAVELRQQFMRRRQGLFEDTYARIRAVLSPEQRERFDRSFVPRAMRRHHRRWRRHLQQQQ